LEVILQPFVFFPVCPARASATVFVPSGMEDHGRNTSCNMLETVALAKNSVNTVIFATRIANMVVLNFRGAKNILVFTVIFSPRISKTQKHHVFVDFCHDEIEKKAAGAAATTATTTTRRRRSAKKRQNMRGKMATSCGMKRTSHCALHLRAPEHMNNTNTHTNTQNPYCIAGVRSSTINIYTRIPYSFSFPTAECFQ
jgi:hypothetical protein